MLLKYADVKRVNCAEYEQNAVEKIQNDYYGISKNISTLSPLCRCGSIENSFTADTVISPYLYPSLLSAEMNKFILMCKKKH